MKRIIDKISNSLKKEVLSIREINNIVLKKIKPLKESLKSQTEKLNLETNEKEQEIFFYEFIRVKKALKEIRKIDKQIYLQSKKTIKTFGEMRKINDIDKVLNVYDGKIETMKYDLSREEFELINFLIKFGGTIKSAIQNLENFQFNIKKNKCHLYEEIDKIKEVIRFLDLTEELVKSLLELEEIIYKELTEFNKVIL